MRSYLGKWSRGGGGSASSTQGETIFVTRKEDFGTPDGSGVVTLQGGAYLVLSSIDLEGDSLYSDQPTTIVGIGAEAVMLTSTGLTGRPLLEVEHTLQLRTISLSMPAGELCVKVDGTVNGSAIDWLFVNFNGGGRAFEGNNVTNFIGNTLAIVSGDGLYFDGTVGTVGLSDSILAASASGGCGVCMEASSTVTRRLRFDQCAVVATPGTTGISVQPGSIVNPEGFILLNVNLAGGGTLIDGIDYLSDKARFIESRGITNSTRVGEMYWQGNATSTPIASTSTFYKALGTSTPSPLNQRFSHANNRLTYTSSLEETFVMTATLTLSSGNNNQIEVAFYKNGTTQIGPSQIVTANSAGRVENASLQTIATLTQGDYIEVWVANDTGTSAITVTAMDTIARTL